MADTSLLAGWDQLRRHLEWTIGLPSVSLLALSLSPDAADLADRIALLAARRREPIRLLSGTGDELTGEITDLLPTPGFTVLQLPFGGERSAERRQVLSRLNELRSRLADPDQGSLVILGTSTLAAECVSAAADLWSVRSLFLSIIAPTLAVVPSEIETRPDDLGDALLFPAYTIAERERTERTPHTLRLLAVASRSAAHDLSASRVTAREAIRESPEGTVERALAIVAEAELAGRGDDPEGVRLALTRALKEPALVGPKPATNLLDLVRRVALETYDLGSAGTASERLLSLRRDLAERIATPESLRDLSISLNNVGAVARARGDWDRATTVYEESLTIARDLAERDDSMSTRNLLAWLLSHPPVGAQE